MQTFFTRLALVAAAAAFVSLSPAAVACDKDCGCARGDHAAQKDTKVGDKKAEAAGASSPIANTECNCEKGGKNCTCKKGACHCANCAAHRQSARL